MRRLYRSISSQSLQLVVYLRPSALNPSPTAVDRTVNVLDDLCCSSSSCKYHRTSKWERNILNLSDLLSQTDAENGAAIWQTQTYATQLLYIRCGWSLDLRYYEIALRRRLIIRSRNDQLIALHARSTGLGLVLHNNPNTPFTRGSIHEAHVFNIHCYQASSKSARRVL